MTGNYRKLEGNLRVISDCTESYLRGAHVSPGKIAALNPKVKARIPLTLELVLLSLFAITITLCRVSGVGVQIPSTLRAQARCGLRNAVSRASGSH